MKKKMIGRVSAMAVAGTMMFGGMQIPAMAATGDNVVQFKKVLEMQNAQGASVPNVTYTYTIAAGTGIGATANSPEVKAGVGTPTIADVTYAKGDSITKNAKTDQDEVIKNVSITFPAGTFTAPGIYRYVITESANTTTGSTETNADITDVDSNTRYLDVYVVNDTDGGYKIDASVFTETAVTPTFDKDTKQPTYGGKNSDITDAYSTYELSLDKVVEGNMGNKDQLFNFTINFSGPANTSFTFGDQQVDLDAQGNGSVNLQLADATAIAEITGIPSTVTYTVTENLSSSEGYDTTFAVKRGTGTSQGIAKDTAASNSEKVTATSQSMTKADNAVVVTNTKRTVSPTGIMLSVTPYALLAGLASALGALFFRRKKLS